MIILKKIKWEFVIGIIFVVFAGCIFHFAYDWTGKNGIVGLFVPVNESVWEHMKLLFFPMLFYFPVFVMISKKDRSCVVSSYCTGILTGTSLIPILFYVYTNILKRDILVLDISIFVLCTVAAFGTVYFLNRSCRLKDYSALLCGLVIVSLLCFLVFTCYPPDHIIFSDPLAG